MKKTVLSIMAVSVFSVGVYGYSQTQRIQDMQTMEVAMAKIQKGILYNNSKMILKGIENLQAASSKIEIAPKHSMDYSSVYAKKRAKNIIKFSKKIKSEIEANHKHGATDNYAKVLNQCVSCHNQIRKWNH